MPETIMEIEKKRALDQDLKQENKDKGMSAKVSKTIGHCVRKMLQFINPCKTCMATMRLCQFLSCCK